jgi:hypothetical protein
MMKFMLIVIGLFISLATCNNGVVTLKPHGYWKVEKKGPFTLDYRIKSDNTVFNVYLMTSANYHAWKDSTFENTDYVEDGSKIETYPFNIRTLI